MIWILNVGILIISEANDIEQSDKRIALLRKIRFKKRIYVLETSFPHLLENHFYFQHLSLPAQ